MVKCSVRIKSLAVKRLNRILFRHKKQRGVERTMNFYNTNLPLWPRYLLAVIEGSVLDGCDHFCCVGIRYSVSGVIVRGGDLVLESE